MADRIIRIKNNTGADGTWRGVELIDQEYYTIPPSEFAVWQADEQVFDDVAQSNLIVNNGANVVDDFNEPLAGWNWIIGNTLPMSDLGNKLAVHSSSKPLKANKELYTVWTGSGDDVVGGVIGGGPLIQLSTTIGTPKTSFDVEFYPQFGDVYIHQGLISWENGSIGDNADMFIVARPTQLQTLANLDLIVVNDIVKFAPGGPGTGTHGFAANPVLLPRTASKDGNWDYTETGGLVPNMTGTGLYDISTIERSVHRYVNKMIIKGTGDALLQSQETAYIPPGYFIRVTLNNVSDTVWSFGCMLEIFRETTYIP